MTKKYTQKISSYSPFNNPTAAASERHPPQVMTNEWLSSVTAKSITPRDLIAGSIAGHDLHHIQSFFNYFTNYSKVAIRLFDTVPTNTIQVPITTGTVTDCVSVCTGFIWEISGYIYRTGEL